MLEKSFILEQSLIFLNIVNPAFVKRQFVGVYNKDLLNPFANALKNLVQQTHGLSQVRMVWMKSQQLELLFM